MTQATVLLADDEETLRENLTQVLTEEGFEVISCADGTEALRALKDHSVDAVITDLRMPGVHGMALLDYARELAPEAPVVVITAFGEVETAVEAMKKGARDYLCKPLIFDEVVLKLKHLVNQKELARKNRLLREEISRRYDFSGIVAVSDAMRNVLGTIKRVASTRSNVLIMGESGTGKEAFARALHFNSITKEGPFVAVNCGALTEGLIESQLFGYRRGAFTGAASDRIGYFESADGGSLFLDEIGNLSLAGQAALLRAIEEKAVIRIGDTRPRRVNIRIIAATNSDLEGIVERKEFRKDLFYRLNVIRIDLPPLRERPEDIPPLVDHFVAKYNEELNCNCPGFSEAAMKAMCAYAWPGNVRELENVVERALIFACDRYVELNDLSLPMERFSEIPEWKTDLRSAIHEFERQHVLKILKRFGNNKVRAAEALGIGLSSLYRKIEELDIGKQLPKRNTEEKSA